MAFPAQSHREKIAGTHGGTLSLSYVVGVCRTLLFLSKQGAKHAWNAFNETHVIAAVHGVASRNSSMVLILSPIQRTLGTAQLLPIALYRGPSAASLSLFFRRPVGCGVNV